MMNGFKHGIWRWELVVFVLSRLQILLKLTDIPSRLWPGICIIRCIYIYFLSICYYFSKICIDSMMDAIGCL
jgi:hypothetical protein